MSEEQEKKQVKSSSSAKKKEAELLNRIEQLEKCVSKLATYAGQQKLVKEFGLDSYEYQSHELKRVR